MVHSLISLSIGFAWNVAHDAELGGKEKEKKKKKEKRKKKKKRRKKERSDMLSS